MGEGVGKFVDEHYKEISGAFLFKICIFIGEYHCSDCIHTELTSVPFSEEVDMKNTIITEVYI